MSIQSFIDQISPYAIEDMISSSVLASITIAQAGLESAWGASAPGNNLFGIKGSGTTQDTREFINGQWMTIPADFRTYPDWISSIADHSKFLKENDRYTKAGFFSFSAARDYAGASRALQIAGYATDPQYATKLIQIIESNGLQQYDREADEMLKEVADLQNQVQALLTTTQQQSARIAALEAMASMSVPVWASEAVNSAVTAGIIDSPSGGSYDFYRLLTIFHRKQLI